MLPNVAIVGRPNVGKSTLFNVLTRSRDALVGNEPGVTRDRNYGIARVSGAPFIVVDTGGLTEAPDPIARMTGAQAKTAIAEADLVLLVVDARDGLNAEDERIARDLRGHERPVLVVVNKVDEQDPAIASAEFHALGFEHLAAISAAHRRGIRGLANAIRAVLPPTEDATADGKPDDGLAVAVVGRPNVGKSTLVNRLTGSDRMLAHDLPGTTRDSVRVPFQWNGRAFQLIDTAGVRRRARISGPLEKFSVVKTLEAIESATVVIMLVDAADEITDQDLHLLGLVLASGRALVVAANKWDGLDSARRGHIKEELARRLRFADFARQVFISARHASGLGQLMRAVCEAHRAATAKLSTPELTRVLQAAVAQTPPPSIHGRRIKLRYAHQGGSNPPRVVIHGNQTERLPEHYKRYLIRVFRDAFDLLGTPVALELRSSSNPYSGRKNVLTPRQQRKRKRLMKKVKR